VTGVVIVVLSIVHLKYSVNANICNVTTGQRLVGFVITTYQMSRVIGGIVCTVKILSIVLFILPEWLTLSVLSENIV